MANKEVTDITFKIMPNAERTLLVTWKFSGKNLENFEYEWFYRVGTGDDIPDGGVQTTTYKVMEYSPPDNAIKVRLRIRPVGKKGCGWTGQWVRTALFNLETTIARPETPSTPDVSLDDNYHLTATVDVTDSRTDSIQFELVYENGSSWKSFNTTSLLPVSYQRASHQWTVNAGKTYRARCRAYYKKADTYSDWSDFSGTNKTSAGAIRSGSLTVSALSSTSVQLKWEAAEGADEYEVEYVNRESDFYATTSTNTQSGYRGTTANIYGLSTGQDYYFRVRGKANDVGSGSDGCGPWSNIAHIILGKKPTVPTTWSNTTVAMVGEEIILYWIHNSADGSKQRAAQIELNVNGRTSIITPSVTVPGEEDDEKTYSHKLSASSYGDGSVIQWRVRTKGIVDDYSDWSITRMIKVYAPPSLYLGVSGMTTTDEGNKLSQYPFSVILEATPTSQTALGYQIEFISRSQYSLFDQSGSIKRININDVIFSRYFPASSNYQTFSFTPEAAILENAMDYTIKVTVSMDSGLHATAEYPFYVEYAAMEGYNLEAYILVDTETATCQIRPRCISTEDESIIPNISFTILRREYDGTLTEIMSGMRNENQSYATDLHPALDYARYRIVAIFLDTGQIDFFDPSDEPVGIKDVILNWEEMREGMPSDSTDEALIDPRWVGGMLRLSYNIDIDDTMKPDAEIVDYIGRERGVAYYSPKKEHTSKWSVAIDKEDTETIRILRSIGAWTDNVYVREPSGTGYWASIDINMSQKHNDPVVPISISITRVEGGM